MPSPGIRPYGLRREGKVQVEIEVKDPAFTAHTPVWVSAGKED